MNEKDELFQSFAASLSSLVARYPSAWPEVATFLEVLLEMGSERDTGRHLTPLEGIHPHS